MAATKDVGEPELDEDGLEIQQYVSRVLVVLPPEGYGEQALRFCRSSLYNVHVGTRTVSSQSEELIRGRLQDEFQVDGPIRGETMEPYSGLIVVGGEPNSAFLDDPEVQRLVREAKAANKLIGTWGNGAAILARAGVLKGVKLTAPPELRSEIQRAGGRWTGRQVERSGRIVTGIDEAVGMRLGQELAHIVGI